MSSTPRPSRPAWALLGVLLALLALPQAVLTAARVDMNIDGGFYTNVARHVRDGEGLVTDLSLYHAGFPHFPHPTPIYPLWPWLYGLVARVLPLEAVAHWLPYGLYLASLLGAWCFGRALAPGPLFPEARGPLRHLRHIDAGHVLLVLLGTQREYSRFTTFPYTEALAFSLLFFGLWGVLRLRPRPGPLLAAGAWLALLCLTRSQLFIAPIAAGGALGLLALAGPGGRRWLLPGLGGLAVVGATLAAWWLQARTFLPEASPLILLRFDQARVSDVLPPLDVIKNSHGLLDFVGDRLDGVALAWDPTRWRRSYHKGFFTLHWALPLAGVLAVPALVRAARAGRAAGLGARLRRWADHPRAFATLFLVLLALGALASVHLPHKKGFGTWYFNRRHAVVCILAFYPALLFLLRRAGRLGRVAGLLVLLSTVGLGVRSFALRVAESRDEALDPHQTALVDWLGARGQGRGPQVVALQANHPPELAWRTRDVGYHWFYERTALADLETMADVLGAERVIYRERETRGWRFRRDPAALEAAFQADPTAPPGWVVLARRPPETAPGR